MKRFREAIKQQDFVITADLPLQPLSTSSQIEATVKVLSPAVDAIQIADDRFAVGHMSALAAASIVLQSGLDVVVQISCRDRNRMALQADILGAAALGITTLALVRGEKFKNSSGPRAKGVFHISETQLINMAGQIGADVNLVSDPGFHIGSIVTAFKPAENWQAQRIQEKIDAGVKFLQTQPCLNANVLRRYMQKLVEQKITHRAAVIVTVPLLTSALDAKGLKEKDKGALIPDAVIKRIAGSDDSVAEGVAVCAEMIAEIQEIPGISGVNIHCGGDPQNIVSAIRQSDMARPPGHE